MKIGKLKKVSKTLKRVSKKHSTSVSATAITPTPLELEGIVQVVLGTLTVEKIVN